MAEEQIEVLLESVLDQLKSCSVAQLGEVCLVLELVIPLNKTGKQAPIRNMIRNHLTRDEVEASEDQGLQLITSVDTRLKTLLEKKTEPTVKEERKETVVQKSNGGGGSSTSGSNDNVNVNAVDMSRVSVTRLRDFKIKGGTVGLEEGSLDYTSLVYRITEGKQLGYSMKEIRSGVVDAMKGELRKYFESSPGLSDEEFMETLYSKYEVNNNISIFNKLTNASQEPKEAADDFTLRVMNMRNFITALAKEGKQDVPMDEKMVWKAYYHTLAIGYAQDNIRLHLQNFLKTEPDDRSLLVEVRRIVGMEKEHLKKLRGGKGVDVKSVDSQVTSVDAVRDDKILTALSKLTEKVEKIDVVDKKLTELEKFTKKEIATIKNQMAGMAAGGVAGGAAGGAANGGNGEIPANVQHNRNRYVKCDACRPTNAFCRHCTKCGEEGHKRYQCHLNEQ